MPCPAHTAASAVGLFDVMVSSGCMRASPPGSPAHDDAGLPAVATGFLPVVIYADSASRRRCSLLHRHANAQQETRRRTCSDTRLARRAPSNGPPDERASPESALCARTGLRPSPDDGPPSWDNRCTRAPARRSDSTVPTRKCQPGRRSALDSFEWHGQPPQAILAVGSARCLSGRPRPATARGRTHRGRSPAGAQARGGDGPRQDAVGGSALVAGPPIFCVATAR